MLRLSWKSLSRAYGDCGLGWRTSMRSLEGGGPSERIGSFELRSLPETTIRNTGAKLDHNYNQTQKLEEA